MRTRTERELMQRGLDELIEVYGHEGTFARLVAINEVLRRQDHFRKSERHAVLKALLREACPKLARRKVAE